MPLAAAAFDAAAAALDARGQAVMRQLGAAGYLSAAGLAQKTGAREDELLSLLQQLKSAGLVEEYPPSPLRPFARLWRAAPVRVVTVQDLLAGGAEDAGRGWKTLLDVQRDWPWVRALDEPADGALAEERVRAAAGTIEASAAAGAADTAAEAQARAAAIERKRQVLELVREIHADLQKGEGWALDRDGLAAALADLESFDGVAPAFLESVRARIAALDAAPAGDAAADSEAP